MISKTDLNEVFPIYKIFYYFQPTLIGLSMNKILTWSVGPFLCEFKQPIPSDAVHVQ